MKQRLANMNPLSTLHRSLIPDLSATWKPPIFYYGWSMGDLLPVLLEYAQKKKIVQYTVIGNVYKPVAPTGEKLYDSDDESDEDSVQNAWQDDDSDEDEDEPGEILVDELTSAQNALWAMVEEAGVCVLRRQFSSRPFEICGVSHGPDKLAISLYSNYELDRAHAIPADDIAKVQKHLGIQEAPAWYVSNVDYTWSKITPRW